MLTWNGKALKYGTDFYIPEYDSAKSDKTTFTRSGTYDLTVVGRKNFTGKIPVRLTISNATKQIAMNKVSVKGIKSQSWTGIPIKPSGFTVSYKKDVLTEANGDYVISFGENTAVGTGKVTLTGTGKDSDGDGYSYSKRHNKFLLPVPAKAIYGNFCRIENEIFNVVNYILEQKQYRSRSLGLQ